MTLSPQEADAKALAKAKLEDMETRCADQVAEAQKRADELRRQMQAMAESVPEVIRKHTAEVQTRLPMLPSHAGIIKGSSVHANLALSCCLHASPILRS